eukprot:gene34945-42320_t
MILCFLIFTLHLLVVTKAVGITLPISDPDDEWPETIPVVAVRRDAHTHEFVSIGGLTKLNGVKSRKDLIDAMTNRTFTSTKISMKEFRQTLQCAPSEPDLDGNRGTISLMKMITFSKEMVKVVCAWAESNCSPWSHCHKLVEQYSGAPPTGRPSYLGSPYQAKLMRVIKGSLYLDWPWGIERFKASQVPGHRLYVLNSVLDVIGHELKDSVFLMGEEFPFAPFDLPFPVMTSSTSVKHGDIPFPWWKGYEHALVEHTTPKKHRRRWTEKLNKAAFYGGLSQVRRIVLDVALVRPDLIDGGYLFSGADIKPWNPLSKDASLNDEIRLFQGNTSEAGAGYFSDSGQLLEAGHATPLIRYKMKSGVQYMHKYKYLVVLLGQYGHATADRLSECLGIGAVVLMQESANLYHFSARLKPWVHYVPITYSGADIARKVLWLQNNEEKAHQIMMNALAFHRSYLRLEDHYCYIARALEVLGEMMHNTTATLPFSPIPLPPVDHW